MQLSAPPTLSMRTRTRTFETTRIVQRGGSKTEMSSLLVNTPRGGQGIDTSFSLPDTPAHSRVDQLVKRLEEACDRVAGDQSISIMRKDPASAVYVPLRVKEIVQECLTPPSTHSWRSAGGRGEGKREVVRYVEMWRDEGGGKGGGGVRMVNRARGDRELERVKEHLDIAQKQNEELSLKYIAVSEKVEEIFQLKAEVSSLTFQLASLREDNSRLQRTLLDQETSFSYALKNCQAERMDREQRIGKQEEQLKQYQSKCRELELELRVRQASVEEEHSQLSTNIRRLEQELQRVKSDGRNEVERVKREERENTHHLGVEFEKELQSARRDGQDEVEMVRRKGEEEVLRVRREAEELEKTRHLELREAVERADMEEQKVAELSLINEHLQQQLAESQVAGSRLTEDVHQLSLTLSHTQNRLKDMEREQQLSFICVQEQSVRSQQASLSLALRDVASVQRELVLLSQAVQSDLHSGGREVCHTAERITTLLHQMTATHDSELRLLRESLQRQREDSERYLQEELSRVQELSRQATTQLESDLHTHITAHQETLTELESIKETVCQLTSDKQRLERELEKSQRCVQESEVQRSAIATQVEDLQGQKVTLETARLQQQQQLLTLREELHQHEQMATSRHQELTSQHEETKRLQTQLDTASQELESMKSQLAQLRSDYDKVGAENSENILKLRAMAVESEQCDTVLSAAEETVGELRRALAEKEEEKQRIKEQLQRVEAEVKEATKRETEIVQLRDSLEEEVEKLKLKNTHLVQEASQLSSSWKEVQSDLDDAQNERDRLTKETSSLTQCLTQYKTALEEIQRQRSTLNTTVANTTQEKADLMREKVSLSVQVGTLEDTLSSLGKKLSLVSLEKERLEQRVKDSERRMFLAELNKSVVSREGSISSTDLKRSLSGLLSHANEGQQEVCEKMLDEYKPLCDTLAQMKRRENELQEELKISRLQYETELKTIQETHARGISSIRKQHEEMHGTWRNETEMLRKNLCKQQQQMQAQLREVQMEATRKCKTECADEHAKWQSDLTTLQTELRLERQRVSETEQKLQGLTQVSTQNSQLTEQLNSSQLQLEQLRREMESLRENNALLFNAREELSATVARVEDTNRALKESLASAVSDSETYRQQVTELEEHLAELQGCNQELLEEKGRTESVLFEVQRDKTSLESQLLAMRTEMSSMTEKLERSQLSLDEVESNYRRLLEDVEQVIEPETDNPLHTVEGLTLPLTSKIIPGSKPEAVCQALLGLRNERDQLREATLENAERQEQCRRDLEHMSGEKNAAETRVRALQSSLASLQVRYDTISQQHDTREAESKEAKISIDALQIERSELQLQNKSLRRQLVSVMETQKEALKKTEEDTQKKCCELEQKMRETETLKNSHKEEVVQLTNMVTILKSSQVNKERKLAELEERFQNTQQEMLEREVTFKSTERTRLALEQRLVQFEQGSLRQESTKRELQSRVQYLESQLREIQEKTKSLRRDLARLQRENQSLTGDVECLRKCLKTTTEEKQSLTQSQEREIDRLRAEVEKQLYENSALKVQLVHNHTSPSSACIDPSVDELISISRTQLQSVQLSSSTESCGVGAEDDAGVWREKCYKYRAAIQQLKRKVRHLEKKVPATKLIPPPTADSPLQLYGGEATTNSPFLHHQLEVHTTATHSGQQVTVGEEMGPPSSTSTPRKVCTSS